MNKKEDRIKEKYSQNDFQVLGLTYFFDQLIQLIWYKFADCQSFEICEPQIKLRSYLLIILDMFLDSSLAVGHGV